MFGAEVLLESFLGPALAALFTFQVGVKPLTAVLHAVTELIDTQLRHSRAKAAWDARAKLGLANTS